MIKELEITMQMPTADVHFHLNVLKMSTQLQTFQQIETAVTFGADLLPITFAIANYLYPSSGSQV